MVIGIISSRSYQKFFVAEPYRRTVIKTKNNVNISQISYGEAIKNLDAMG